MTEREIIRRIRKEAQRGKTPKSLHEAYATIQEEVDELWEETKRKPKRRRRKRLERELIQIAARAVKAIQSLDRLTK